MKEIKIGVVGYSINKCDLDLAKDYIKKSFDIVEKEYENFKKVVISGLTNIEIPHLAYKEAVKRGWLTYGIACEKAKKFKWFNVDDYKIIGENWGDESKEFIDMLDVLIRIGGGKQSLKEVEMAKLKNILIIEYELSVLN